MPRFLVSLMASCLLLLAFVSPGRCQLFNEVVYLKNGSILKGVIVEQVPGKTIKVQTADGSFFIVKYEEIERFGRPTDVEVPVLRPVARHKPVKYQNNTTFNVIVPFSDAGTGDVAFGFTMVNGARFGAVFALGIGSGYSSFDDVSYVPVFLEARTYLTQTDVEPFLYGKIGYGYQFYSHLGRDFSSGGLLLGLGTGLQISVNRGFCFVLDFGLDFQNYSYQGYDYQTNYLKISPGFAF